MIGAYHIRDPHGLTARRIHDLPLEKGAPGAEGVVSDDELALTAVEGNAVGGRGEGESSTRSWKGDGKSDVRPVDDTGNQCKR